MKNYIHQQDRESYANAGNALGLPANTTIASGAVVVISAAVASGDVGRIGIAVDNIPFTSPASSGELQVEGVVSLPVAAGQTLTQGQQCTWDSVAQAIYPGNPTAAATESSHAITSLAYAGRVADGPSANGLVNVSLNHQ